MKIKKVILILLLSLLIILFFTNNVKAVVQSSGGTAAAYNINSWMINIRNMENLGAGMGLNEELNEDLTSTTSNNIDIHMQKNTEYGALAILSASSYGNPNVIASGDTTTGNKSGVVMNINKEWVAAGCDELSATNFKNSALRYKNIYTTSYAMKIGDAISETYRWHGAATSSWIQSPSAGGLLRSYSGSVFSYKAEGDDSSSPGNVKFTDSYYTKPWYSRSVIVVGQGL